jgi:hypothetical protein
MGLRLSFGLGPLRASVPLTGRRRRRRRSAARSHAPSFHGTANFADGSAYTCHHAHRTREAATECAAKYKRDLAAGKPVPPRTRPRSR